MADDEQHPWIFGMGHERETLIWELRGDNPSPLRPGLEAQNRQQADFTEDSRQLFDLFSQLLPEMGNLNQAISIANNGIIMFMNLLDLANIPAHVAPCALCINYNFDGNLPITVWNALPQGPGILPPLDYTEQQAIDDSYICDVIGPTGLLFPILDIPL